MYLTIALLFSLTSLKLKGRYLLILMISLLRITASGQVASALPIKDAATTQTIFDIIRSGDSKQLAEQLDKGLNPNDSLDSYTYLMMASLSGTTEEMKILLAHGANVNYSNRDSLTALWMAVPDYDKSSLLIAAGADINSITKGGNTIMQKLAIIQGSLSLIKLLIEKGANLLENNKENALVIRATISADTNMLSFFIRAGLDANAPDKSGNYPIVIAAQYHCLETIKLLVNKGAKINVANKARGMTALMTAARAGDEATIAYLLDQGADASAVSKIGYSALTYLGLSDLDRPDFTEAMYRQLGNKAFVKGADGADGIYWMEKKGNTKSVQLLKNYKRPQN